MEKHIERLIDGQFEYERGMLEFSEQRIECTLRPGDMIEGSFTVFGPEDRPVEGFVSSTEIRMEVLTPSFSGAQDVIGYRFRAEGLSSGDVIKGDFRIISNRGEYMLPFVVTVELEHVESTMGEIRNLFHFANLAKTDWNEAMNLFYHEDFILLLSGHDAQYRSVYRGLKGAPRSAQSMEEFLIAIKKKKSVTYLPDKAEILLENPDSVNEETLTLSRNGWGYTELEVSADGDFLQLSKDRIDEEDFIGNSCRYRFRIDPGGLHAGNNFGSVTFSNAYFYLRVPVTVRMIVTPSSRENYLQMKRLTLDLIRLYSMFRLRRIPAQRWLQEAGEITSKMRALDPEDPVPALYQAHYLITANRAGEGARLLSEQREFSLKKDGSEAVYCYYLYLTTLLDVTDEEIAQVQRQIRSAWYGNPEDWRIAWLMQFVSDEYTTSVSAKWELFKEQYARGARSRIIYIEALLLCASHPATLMRLDDFEIAMLRMAVREKLLPAQLIERIVYLARGSKRYDEAVFHALTACYEMKPQDETLTEICAMLIKGARTDAEAHEWYDRGVRASLRLTRLYEYFMMSVGTDEQGAAASEIPRAVLMYFSHGSDLDYKSNALLYRYICEHRDAGGELYEMYEQRIRDFCARQIAQGRIDETLAFLYRKFLDESMVTAENAHTVLRVLHTSRIRVGHEGIKEIVLIYDKLLHERTYPVTNGVAYVPLYGAEYVVLLADRAGRRYAEGITFDTDKLMLAGRLVQLVSPYITGGEEYIDLFLCEQGSAYNINMENVAGYRMLSASNVLDMDCRSEIRQHLIRFYHDNDFTRQLSEALQEEDPSEMSVQRRNEVLELMVLFDNADRALKWMKRFGTYGIDPKVIMRMCARLTDREAYHGDEAVIAIIFHTFRRGRYDNTVLEFLVREFSGTVREMRDLWKAAVSFGVDSAPLLERIIDRMLYSGAYVGERIDIFKEYVQQGASGDIEIAFLAQCAYDHFVRESVTNEFIYRRIGRLLAAGTKLPDVCGMDYLKYFAGRRTGEFDLEVAEEVLKKLTATNRYFPFFSEYTDILPKAGRFSERVILHYRTRPHRRVTAHYMLHREGGEESEKAYTTKRMVEMYDSIYVLSFMLFFGEELQYYITESSDAETDDMQEEQLTESGMLSRSDIRHLQTEGGRFSVINDLCVAEALKDYETFDRLIQEYEHVGFLTEQLFRMREET
ncbi:MAG: hypothetical protein IJR00_10845 [Lachnospiraceae bacterium]|nr:hypothetical protein [Lachnospiraceae bacterium]